MPIGEKFRSDLIASTAEKLHTIPFRSKDDLIVIQAALDAIQKGTITDTTSLRDISPNEELAKRIKLVAEHVADDTMTLPDDFSEAQAIIKETIQARVQKLGEILASPKLIEDAIAHNIASTIHAEKTLGEFRAATTSAGVAARRVDPTQHTWELQEFFPADRLDELNDAVQMLIMDEPAIAGALLHQEHLSFDQIKAIPANVFGEKMQAIIEPFLSLGIPYEQIETIEDKNIRRQFILNGNMILSLINANPSFLPSLEGILVIESSELKEQLLKNIKSVFQLLETVSLDELKALDPPELREQILRNPESVLCLLKIMSLDELKTINLSGVREQIISDGNGFHRLLQTLGMTHFNNLKSITPEDFRNEIIKNYQSIYLLLSNHLFTLDILKAIEPPEFRAQVFKHGYEIAGALRTLDTLDTFKAIENIEFRELCMTNLSKVARLLGGGITLTQLEAIADKETRKAIMESPYLVDFIQLTKMSLESILAIPSESLRNCIINRSRNLMSLLISGMTIDEFFSITDDVLRAHLVENSDNVGSLLVGKVTFQTIIGFPKEKRDFLISAGSSIATLIENYGCTLEGLLSIEPPALRDALFLQGHSYLDFPLLKLLEADKFNLQEFLAIEDLAFKMIVAKEALSFTYLLKNGFTLTELKDLDPPEFRTNVIKHHDILPRFRAVGMPMNHIKQILSDENLERFLYGWSSGITICYRAGIMPDEISAIVRHGALDLIILNLKFYKFASACCGKRISRIIKMIEHWESLRFGIGDFFRR